MDRVLVLLLICVAPLFPCNPQLLTPIITQRLTFPRQRKTIQRPPRRMACPQKYQG